MLDSLPPGHLDAAAPPSGFSAPRMFAFAIAPAGIVDVGGMPPSCPTRTESGNATILEGGCTDDDGDAWFGRAVVPNNAISGVPSNGTITYEGFGSESDSSCTDVPGGKSRTLTDGTATFAQTSTGVTFDLDVIMTVSGVRSDCSQTPQRAAISYSGSMARDGNAQVWNGSGSIGADELGRFDAQTDDERVDSSQCNTEPLSGSTTVTAGSDIAIVTYDGATDCDPEGTATWTLNGVDQGELTGVNCSAAPGRRGSAGVALAALGLALALRVRRR